MIAIIDYGMGNLRSLKNAIEYIGYEPTLITEPDQAKDADHLILPGVGAFGKAMENLRRTGFDEAIGDHVRAGKPLLGICLGMQLLAARGTEFGDHAGLGLIEGEVIQFVPSDEFPIPHVGWNDYTLVRRHPVFANVKKNIDFYFVHSFHFVPASQESVLTTSHYGREFVSSVAQGPVVGFQFHPEKSQQGGLTLLDNFLMWDGTC